MNKQILTSGIHILQKLESIAALYEEKDLEIVLDQVYEELKGLKRVPTVETTAIVTTPQKVKSNFEEDEIKEILEKLETLSKEGFEPFLMTYTKPKIIGIIKALGLKVSSKDSKQKMISTITHYYGFDQLNKKMSQRVYQK